MSKNRPQREDVLARRGFVQSYADSGGATAAQVIAALARGLQHSFGARAGSALNRIESGRMHNVATKVPCTGSQNRRVARDSLGDASKAVRPMIDRVHACDHSRQYLRRTNIAGRFFAANMLLAGLQCQSVSGRSMHVNTDT